MRAILVVSLWLQIVQALAVKRTRDYSSVPADGSFHDSPLTLSDPSEHDLISKDTTFISSAPHYFIQVSCDRSKKASIADAWKEAKLLADAQTRYTPGYSYSIPHTQWLGKEWNSQAHNRRRTLDDNFRRLALMFERTPQAAKNVYWHCNDIAGRCAEGLDVYSWNDSMGHHTVFCDSFHVRKNIDELLDLHSHDRQQQKIMENFHCSKGQIVLRQIWTYMGSSAEERIAHPQVVWDQAGRQDISPASVSVDSYVLDAVAIYVQQHYRSSMSPIPFRELRKLNPATIAPESELADDGTEEQTFGSPSAVWTGRINAGSQMTSETWEEISPPTSSLRISSAPVPLAAQAAFLYRANASH